jgi:hypothetical protein
MRQDVIDKTHGPHLCAVHRHPGMKRGQNGHSRSKRFPMTSRHPEHGTIQMGSDTYADRSAVLLRSTART